MSRKDEDKLEPHYSTDPEQQRIRKWYEEMDKLDETFIGQDTDRPDPQQLMDVVDRMTNNTNRKK